jgi:hypothetical protein
MVEGQRGRPRFSPIPNTTMPRPSYSEIASSFDLWQEHIDPNATTTESVLRDAFNAMDHAVRVAWLVEMWGPEPDAVPTVDDVLARTAIGGGLHQWTVIGGSITLTTDQLRPLLEETYDPADPDWEAMVDDE